MLALHSCHTDVAITRDPRIYRSFDDDCKTQYKCNERFIKPLVLQTKDNYKEGVSRRVGSEQIIIGRGDTKWSGSWLDFTCSHVCNQPGSEAWHVCFSIVNLWSEMVTLYHLCWEKGNGNRCTLQLDGAEIFSGYPDLGFFPCFFLSCKANAKV
jgi:hypothetical protein